MPHAWNTDVIRIASWNCAGAFREKVGRALALDADVFVIQEAEPLEKYAALLPAGSETYYEKRPEYPKGVLAFTRPGFTVRPHAGMETAPGYAHVIPLTVGAPDGAELDLWAVWTLDSSPKEVSYIGQAHAGLDALAPTLRPGTVMIGDYNSNAIWDGKRKRNHTTLVDRLSLLGLNSAYHQWTGEPQGQESQPTFYLHRNLAKAFHIDHCFTDLEVAGVEVGTFSEWSGMKATGGVSDHVPLVVSLRLAASARRVGEPA